MNLSKRTLILLVIGLLALIAAVMSARSDEGPEIEPELETEPGSEEEPAARVIVPEAEPAKEVTTFKG